MIFNLAEELQFYKFTLFVFFLQINENDAFIGGNSSQSLINPISSSSTICQLGDTSSNLDDLGTDNFHVLQISEDRNTSDSISVILDNVDLF